MASRYIGYALIVNVKYFEDPEDNREDTVSDQVNVKAAFEKLGFDTKLVTESTDAERQGGVSDPNTTDSAEVNVTIDYFKREFEEARKHVKEQGYNHFAVFISTHGEEVREKDHYIHKLCFYDGDESTEEILFKPLDKQLRKVKKLVIIQACRGRNDEPDGEDEDLGVPICIVEDPAEEYQSSEGSSPPMTEAETVHCVPLCIPNCITMFASPSGKAAYQGHLSDLLLKTVKNLKCGEDVKVLELLREINRQFAERDIDWGTYDNENEIYLSYDVKNIGSIVHCLTEHIVYRIN